MSANLKQGRRDRGCWPRPYAATAVFLASNLSSYVAGRVLCVGGGLDS
jgi:NAD(P)-dependent dehydrogenase (short-subunit alcohol dehydrogenase family)